MCKAGRQPYVATVHGEVDGVPFTNWFKYLKTAKFNCQDSPHYMLTVINTGHVYRWSNHGRRFTAVSVGAPELA